MYTQTRNLNMTKIQIYKLMCLLGTQFHAALYFLLK